MEDYIEDLVGQVNNITLDRIETFNMWCVTDCRRSKSVQIFARMLLNTLWPVINIHRGCYLIIVKELYLT